MKKLVKILTIAIIAVMALSTLIGCNDASTTEGTTLNAKNAYITIDINPSIEIITDADGNLESVSALNNDAELLLVDLDFKGMTVDQAIDKILEEAKKTGYIVDNDKNAILVSVSAENNVDVIESALNEKVKEFAEKGKLNIEFLKATPDQAMEEQAKALGITVSKLKLALLAIDCQKSLTIDTAKDLSVSDLNKIISDSRKDSAKILTEELKYKYELMKAKYEAEEEIKEIGLLLESIKKSDASRLTEYLGGTEYEEFITMFEEKYNEIKEIDIDLALKETTVLTEGEISAVEEKMQTYINAAEDFKNVDKSTNKSEMKRLLKAKKDAKEDLDDYLDDLEDKYDNDIEIVHSNKEYKVIVKQDMDDVFEEEIERLQDEFYNYLENLGIDIEGIEELFEDEIDSAMDEYESQVDIKLDEYKKVLEAEINAIKASLKAEKEALIEINKK